MDAIHRGSRRRALTALLAGGLVCAAAACNRSHTVTTTDGQVTYKEKGKDAGSVKVTGKDGKTATLEFHQGRIPDDYPKDVPVYSGKVVMAQAISEKNARNLMLETSDSAGKIAEFYRKELERNGWRTETTVATGSVSMIGANKDQKQIVIQITDSGGKRSIMQVLSDKD
jgi:hypothetical protein